MDVLSSIRVVLVEPLYSGNIGSVCRAMANMGLSDLVVVAPRVITGWEEGQRMAVHAGDILESRKEVATLAEAIADCTTVVGTTARGGLYRQHVRTAREIAPELLELASHGKVALVFGREDNGLDNEEVAQCTHLIRIPSTEKYSSINLAQAVMICLYELYTATATFEIPDEKSPPVQAAQRQKLFEIWREAMLLIGFMKEDKADHMMQGFQRIFSRGIKTKDDANIMMGVSHQTTWAAKQPRDLSSTPADADVE